MGKRRSPTTDLELFQAIALSLATEELQQGLNIILTIALDTATDAGEKPWNLLPVMGYDDYDAACATAAHAWIKRVTGIDYGPSGVTRFDKRRNAPSIPPETRDLTIDEIEEG